MSLLGGEHSSDGPVENGQGHLQDLLTKLILNTYLQLTDFGFAIRVNHSEDGRAELSKSFCGTAPYQWFVLLFIL